MAVPSYLNFYYWAGTRFERWRSFLELIGELHRSTVGAFARRPITTFAVAHLGFGPWWGFLFVQWIFLALAAYSLGILAGRLDPEGRGKWASVGAFFLSFTVLFSFITPNDSFDEPAQYFFLFLCVNFLLRGQPRAFAISFFGALLARETSALLLPGFAVLWAQEKSHRWKSAAVFAGIPLLAYGLFFFWLGRPDDPQRFLYWQKNFQDGRTTGESLISLALALGVPALLGAMSGFRGNSAFVRAFGISCLINTPIVLLAAYARESRLFALRRVEGFSSVKADEWRVWSRYDGGLHRGNQASVPRKRLAPNGYARAARSSWAREAVGKRGLRKQAWRWILPAALVLLMAVYYHPAYRSAGSYRACAILLALLTAFPLLLRGRSSPELSSP